LLNDPSRNVKKEPKINTGIKAASSLPTVANIRRAR
jgi:hypothetical protein